ncbi:MAG: sulfatase-like hydrolase/transferase, partial [Planctomycetota bacterium]
FAQLSDDEHRDAIRHYLAFCSYEDHLFGRVLDALVQSGADDDTVVMYMSDHGDYACEHGLWCKGLPAFDSAYHIPAIVRPPRGSAAAGRTVEQPVALVDFAPTVLELAGIDRNRPASGRSLMPWLRGETPSDWPEDVFFQSNGNEVYGIQRGVMTPTHRFVFNSFDHDELYDLTNDPGQMTNLARDPEQAGVIKAMYGKLWRFMLKHRDTYVNDYIMTALMDYGPAAFGDDLRSVLDAKDASDEP